MEWTQAILEAAEAKKAPVLIQTSMGAAKYMGGYKLLKIMICNLVDSMNITVPVAIHLDHGDYEAALECIEVGYTSIMFDGSHLPFEEKLKISERALLKKLMLKGFLLSVKLVQSAVKKMESIGAGELAVVKNVNIWLLPELTT